MRVYTFFYDSPVGKLILILGENGIKRIDFCRESLYENYSEKKNGFEASNFNEIIKTGNCEFELKNNFAEKKEKLNEKIIETLEIAVKWLDLYFEGEKTAELPKFDITGTVFQMAVWEELKEIAYGKTVTYGEIAQKIAEKFEKERMSAQAVGNAVGANPVSIMIPCHRVIGKGGKLTGYAGGLDKKRYLLEHEKSYHFTD